MFQLNRTVGLVAMLAPGPAATAESPFQIPFLGGAAGV